MCFCVVHEVLLINLYVIKHSNWYLANAMEYSSSSVAASFLSIEIRPSGLEVALNRLIEKCLPQRGFLMGCSYVFCFFVCLFSFSSPYLQSCYPFYSRNVTLQERHHSWQPPYVFRSVPDTQGNRITKGRLYLTLPQPKHRTGMVQKAVFFFLSLSKP